MGLRMREDIEGEKFDYVLGAVSLSPSTFCSKCRGKKCIYCGQSGLANVEMRLRCGRCQGSGNCKYSPLKKRSAKADKKKKCNSCLRTGIKNKVLEMNAKNANANRIDIRVRCLDCNARGQGCAPGESLCKKCAKQGKMYLVLCNCVCDGSLYPKPKDLAKHKAKCQGMKLIPTRCTNCQLSGRSGARKCTGCLGSTLNLDVENPHLPLDFPCHHNKFDCPGCKRCHKGRVYRMTCYKCVDKVTKDAKYRKCNKCHGTRFNYRKVTDEVFDMLDQVRDQPKKCCSKCHGMGCGKCKNSGLAPSGDQSG